MKIAQPSVNANWAPFEPSMESPIKHRVVHLQTATGKEILQNCKNSKPIDYYVKQKHCAQCGIATAVYLLNTLKRTELITEDTFWPKLAVCLKGILNQKVVQNNGMTLNDFHKLMTKVSATLEVHDFKIDIFYAQEYNITDFLSSLKDSFESNGESEKLAFVNYQPTSILGQDFSGHFSPVSAYSSETDSFLLLDVWTHSEPMWVKAEDLWETVNTKDSDSKISRGWGIIQICKKSD
jgi:hypothetical protein